MTRAPTWLLLLTLGCGPAPAPELDVSKTWSALGDSAAGLGVSPHAASAGCVRMAIDRQGSPWVLWTDDSAGKNGVYLRFWDGARWSALGGSDTGEGVAAGAGTAPSSSSHFSCWGGIDFDSQNRPWVTWMNFDGTAQAIYVRHWTGSAWQGVGGSDTGGGLSANTNLYAWWPRLILDAADQPVVAWHAGSGVYVARWDGLAWTGLGGSNSGWGVSGADAVASLPSLARGVGGELSVAWSDTRTGKGEIQLAHWRAGQWQDLGGALSAGGLSKLGVDSANPENAVDSAGRPVVAWDAPGAPSEIHVRRWNGTAWESLGAGPTLRDNGLTEGDAHHPWLASGPNETLVVAWEEVDAVGQNIHVARWDGARWRALSERDGGVSGTSLAASWPVVAIDHQQNIDLAWQGESAGGGARPYLRQRPAPRVLFVDVSCGEVRGAGGVGTAASLLFLALLATSRGRRRPDDRAVGPFLGQRAPTHPTRSAHAHTLEDLHDRPVGRGPGFLGPRGQLSRTHRRK